MGHTYTIMSLGLVITGILSCALVLMGINTSNIMACSVAAIILCINIGLSLVITIVIGNIEDGG